MRLLAAIVLLALVLAGCSDAADGDAAGASGDADGAGDCLALRVVVVDEAIRPVAAVNVTVTPGGFNATTGDDGAFELPCLEAGEYVVSTQAPGYADLQASFRVGDGEPPFVRLQVETLPRLDPRHDVHHYQGFMRAHAGGASLLVEQLAPGTGGCTCAWTLAPEQEGLTTFIYEADGDVAVENPAPVYGTVYWEFIANPQGDIRWGHASFPLRAVFERSSFAQATDDWTVRITGGQWVHVNQAYDVYVSAWYDMVPPDGWSFVAGGK